jgi:hypothetical protein
MLLLIIIAEELQTINEKQRRGCTNARHFETKGVAYDFPLGYV